MSDETIIVKGNEDDFFITNEKISLFKSKYERYSNFSRETIEVPFSGSLNCNSILNVKLPSMGNLISKLTLKIDLPEVNPNGIKFAWIEFLGWNIIKEISISICGKIIDKQSGLWLMIYNQLTGNPNQTQAINELIGNVKELTLYNNITKPKRTLLIPLSFWFNKYIGLSLPLFLLNKSDINITLQLEEIQKLIISNDIFNPYNIKLEGVSLLIDYFHLTQSELDNVAEIDNEYLIEQIQSMNADLVNKTLSKYSLPFTHPTKEIVWVIQNGLYNCGNKFLYYQPTFMNNNKCNNNEWNIKKASEEIVFKSIVLGLNPNNHGNWFEVAPNTIQTINNFNINNQYTNYVFVNPDSVEGITCKINVDITITCEGNIIIDYLKSTITIEDLSIPTSCYNDTRYKPKDPIVYQPNNFGRFINYTGNSIEYALIEFNGKAIISKQNYLFFNQIQPSKSHIFKNIPMNGIYCYNFSLLSDIFQPTGTVNLSNIDEIILMLWLNCDYNLNNDNKLFVFAVNLNLLKINNTTIHLTYN